MMQVIVSILQFGRTITKNIDGERRKFEQGLGISIGKESLSLS